MKSSDSITMEDVPLAHEQDGALSKSPAATNGLRKETRADPRFTVWGATVDVCSSEIFSISAPVARWKRAELVNLSVSGLQLIAPFKLEVGQQVRVAVEVSTRLRPVQGKAVVQWVKCPSKGRQLAYRAGLQFSDLHPRQEAAIEALAREELFGDVPATLKLATTAPALRTTAEPTPN